MQHFRLSFIVTALSLLVAGYWGWFSGGVAGAATGMLVALILGVLEVSLSFDNAVVNASVLKRMDAQWQQYFLTWGILIAVFGMRLLFPITIVAMATGIDFVGVAHMALQDPATYAKHLSGAHVQIAAFGGMFLLLVFFSFLFDEGKELHWLGVVEEKLSRWGQLGSVEVVLALGLLVMAQQVLPEAIRYSALLAGVYGVMLYVAVDSLSALFNDDETGEAVADTVKKGSIVSFLYLEVLDASFSFDGVIGAFAITQDVVIIMLGLAIGAMFVRSLTVFLVRQGTLDEYVFLEHGAHYAIGCLALIMLASMKYEIPEVVTGLVGAVLIGLSVYSSIRYQKAHADQE